MQKEISTIWSSHLNKEMEIAVYGHFGVNLLLFPSITDNFLENDREGLIDPLAQHIRNGKCRVYSIGAVNFESWLNNEIEPELKSTRHFEYDKFISEEVLKFIYEDCGGPVPIMTVGAAIGAFHAANSYFKRPDLFYGVVAMSGTYNLQHFSRDYFDETCYFNSPIHYLPNLTDSYWLSFLRSRHHVYLMSGSGENEYPGNAVHLGEILSFKGIPHKVDIWGNEWGHNFDTWKNMLAHIMTTKL